MPIIALASTTGIVRPQELALLQRVFDSACQQQSSAPDEADSDALAVMIVGMFMSGTTDEATLLNAVTDSYTRRTA